MEESELIEIVTNISSPSQAVRSHLSATQIPHFGLLSERKYSLEFSRRYTAAI